MADIRYRSEHVMVSRHSMATYDFYTCDLETKRWAFAFRLLGATDDAEHVAELLDADVARRFSLDGAPKG